MSMGLYKEKKPVIQHCCCDDLHTADGEFVIKRPAVADVVYSTQTDHCIKENHPFRKTLILKL